MTVGKAVWQIEGNRVGGKDTNLDVIPSASAADALIRQKGNMLFCNASSYLKPLLLNFAAWIRVMRFFIPETTATTTFHTFPAQFTQADCIYNSTLIENYMYIHL